ncbi:MAG: ATP-binding cassette domain-containing protein [Clostridiaceae bacterium]|jgi:energy-coupling factor transport system ATP-binding protein|nr:ATP-binding cassette domain-containing protein [Bacillota bacterium]NLI37803.1 ATP-binding cassette domain-containing protein [Clostridiaceae bacterium]
MIRFNNVSFSYDNCEELAVSNIHAHIDRGEFVGIIGPSGAGKSTLVNLINGVIPHHLKGDFYGEVLVCGKDTVESSCGEISHHVGSVFQDPESQMVSTVVEDEIAFGLENFNLPADEIENRMTDALKMAGIEHLRHESTAALSGGQKQRVTIAAAIALRPKILVLDEPTSELDPQGSRQVFKTLKRLNQEYGMTILIVEQKVMLLSEFCSRLMVMERGRIIMDGPVRQVLEHHDKLLELGINCPRVVTLTKLLKNASLYFGEFPVDVNEAESVIRRIMEGAYDQYSESDLSLQ